MKMNVWEGKRITEDYYRTADSPYIIMQSGAWGEGKEKYLIIYARCTVVCNKKKKKNKQMSILLISYYVYPYE